MNMYPSTTTLRSYIAYKFSILRMHALRKRLWDKLTGAYLALPVFSEQDTRIRFAASRKLIGVRNIRVAEIVGTLNRDSDFDTHFRPLKKHNIDRWVNAYVLREQDGWSPIIVHKLGDEYFVEDGHHRVSVAYDIGMEYIEAKVWEYAIQSPTVVTCQPTCCMEKPSSRVYVTG
jgi:hypothetical protein